MKSFYNQFEGASHLRISILLKIFRMAYKITLAFFAVLIFGAYSAPIEPSEVVCCNECCQNINVTHSNDIVPSIYQSLYGTYSVVDNDRYYLQDNGGNYGVWWCNEDQNWVIGHYSNMGTCGTWYASANKSNTCVDTFGYDWKWYDYMNGAVLTSAGEGLRLVCSNPTTKFASPSDESI